MSKNFTLRLDSETEDALSYIRTFKVGTLEDPLIVVRRNPVLSGNTAIIDAIRAEAYRNGWQKPNKSDVTTSPKQ